MENPLTKVLMVDDRPENLLTLEAILEPLCASLNTVLVRANSGEEALKHLLHNEFALILLDVQMPGIDGFETAALIKERRRSRHIPIIFITALNKDEQHVFRGYSAGAVDYISKPFNPDILKSKVAVFIELYQKSEQIRRQSELLVKAEQREAERQRVELERELERKHLREIAASEAHLSRFKSTLDATHDCVFIFDATTLKFSYVNQGAVRTFGYSVEEFLEMTPLDMEPLFNHDNFRETAAPLLEGEKESVIFQESARCKDGTFLPVEVLLQFMAAPPDAPTHENRFVAVIRDVTERKRAEAALIAARDEAEQARVEAELARESAENANRAKSDFISGISHELRTPLNAILGFSKLLLNPRIGPLNDNQGAYVQDVVESAEHLLELINDILDLSKIEAGKLSLDCNPICISDILTGSLTIVREAAQRHNLSLQTDLAPEIVALPPVIVDPRKLKQILFNLLSNASKFTLDGGSITMRASLIAAQNETNRDAKHDADVHTASPKNLIISPEQTAARASETDNASLAQNVNFPEGLRDVSRPMILIQVADTGIGIEPEQQGRIFEAFEQVDHSYARQQQGTGLGLALTRRLVSMHEGYIWVESELGKGSTFSVALPLIFDSSEANSVQTQPHFTPEATDVPALLNPGKMRIQADENSSEAGYTGTPQPANSPIANSPVANSSEAHVRPCAVKVNRPLDSVAHNTTSKTSNVSKSK